MPSISIPLYPLIPNMDMDDCSDSSNHMEIIIINKDLWKFHKNVQEHVSIGLLVHFILHWVST
jgi:hypothetical protein